MYELKNLKEPLIEFESNSGSISKEFSKAINGSDFDDSRLLAEIFYEYQKYLLALIRDFC